MSWEERQIEKAEAADALRAHAWSEPVEETRDELRARMAAAICNGVEPAKLPGLDATLDRIFGVIDNPPLRRLVHSRLGGIGADHSLESAREHVEQADEIAWITSMLRHDLAVRVGDRIYSYDVPRPERSEA